MGFDAIEAARTEAARVIALGRSLRGTNWTAPSRCDGWTVADVFGHLANDVERFDDWLDSSLAGRLDPPFPPAHLRADNQAMLERFTGVPGPRRVQDFAKRIERWAGRVAALDPQTPQRHPRGTITVETQCWFAAGEFALHGWDVASALERDWDGPAAIESVVKAWSQVANIDPERDLWTALLIGSGRTP